MPSRTRPSTSSHRDDYSEFSNSIHSRLGSTSDESQQPELYEVSPVFRIDRNKNKGYNKSRYMSISASRVFQKEIMICDIKERQIILYNIAEKSQITISQAYLSGVREQVMGIAENNQFLQNPSACCFIESIGGSSAGDRRSTFAKYIAFLTIEGIYVLQKTDDNWDFFCHFKTDPQTVNKGITIDQYQMSKYVGLEYYR